MNPLIQSWLDAEAEIRSARYRAQQALEAADGAALPANLRPATAKDVVEGAVFWYPEWDARKWAYIDDVLRPRDPWKAYNAHDGCRYGLEGAFVEITAAATGGGEQTNSTALLEARNSQHVLKAEGESPDATDRENCANASPDGGPMGVGQAAAAAPAGVEGSRNG